MFAVAHGSFLILIDRVVHTHKLEELDEEKRELLEKR